MRRSAGVSRVSVVFVLGLLMVVSACSGKPHARGVPDTTGSIDSTVSTNSPTGATDSSVSGTETSASTPVSLTPAPSPSPNGTSAPSSDQPTSLTASTAPTTGPTAVQGGPSTESGFSAPSKEPTTATTTPRSGGSTVTFPSGPTLDNMYPQTWGRFPPGPQCAELANNSRGVQSPVDVSVRITGAASSAAYFSLYDPTPSDTGNAACFMVQTFQFTTPMSCRTGVVLPAYTSASPVVCLLGIATTADTAHVDVVATLEYDFDVTCTSNASTPCGDPRVVAPSAASPVHVRWTASVQLLACFATAGSPGIPQCPPPK
jgi:hypothetical protein